MNKGILLVVCLSMLSCLFVNAADDDGDGIDTAVEIANGTDPFDADTDNDLLLDGQEDINQNGIVDAGETSPLDADTDDDGLSDGEESAYGLNKLIADYDGDGLSDGQELGRSAGIPGGTSTGGISYAGTSASWTRDYDPSGKTDPKDNDTDGDGLNDGSEDRDHDGLVDGTETNPLDADTDDDGLKDGEEDADKDGIFDAMETNPKDSDSDDDNLNDGLEKGRATGIPGGTSEGGVTMVAYTGTSFTWTPDSNPSTVTDPKDADTDNDGLLDGNEDADHDGNLDSGEKNPLDADTDDDGIGDNEESTYSLDPLNADTDNDGLTDGLEIGKTTRIPAGSSYTGIPYMGTDVSWNADTDPSTKTDPKDPDSDNDGILDGKEDGDHDGHMDATETNPVDADTDDDGLKDGDEDKDRDGILDPGESDPLLADSDGDGLNDGLETGKNTPVAGGTSEGSYTMTRVSYYGTATGWTPDSDVSTTTDPLSEDTDADGQSDGVEDTDHDGYVDANETDPNNPDSDGDGIQDKEDCAPLDPSIYPGAPEIPADGIDQDCDGGDLCYRDADDDGYRPDAISTVISLDCDCDDPFEAVESDPVGDCDDSNALFHPGATESCGDPDYNCDGITHENTSSSISETACESYVAPDGEVYSSSGTYTAVIPNAAGCDSTITIHLTVNHSTTSNISETACESYEWNGALYTETGDYTFVTTNAEGCDSTATLHLTVYPSPLPPTISYSVDVLHSDASTGNQWYDQSGPIIGATGQDFTAISEGSYYSIVTLSGCNSAPSNTILVTATDIDLFEGRYDVKIYPNPVSGELTIETEGYDGRTTIEILGFAGQPVYMESFMGKTRISTGNLLPGEYMIKLGDGQTFKYLKMIKN